jgi:hypothetical protein
MKTRLKTAFMVLLGFLVPATAAAQSSSAQPSKPMFELGLGFSVLSGLAESREGFEPGGVVSIAVPLNPFFSIAGELGLNYERGVERDGDLFHRSRTSMLGGFRLRGRQRPVVPFLQALLGSTLASGNVGARLDSETSLTFQPGVGLDFGNAATAFRLQADLRTRKSLSFDKTEFRFSAQLAFFIR